MRELDLLTVFQILLRKIKWLLAAAIVGAVLLGVGSKLFISATYQSKFQMYISNFTQVDSNTYASPSSLTASQTLAGEYIVILKNDLVLNEVSTRLARQGYTVSAAEIRNALKMAPEDNTAMLNIAVTTTNPNLSKAICDALASVAPTKLKEIMQMGNVTVMAPAKKGVQVGPHLIKNTALGAIAGLAIACAVVLITYITDNTVSDEREMRRRLNLTVLGEIPSVQPTKKGGAVNARKKQ